MINNDEIENSRIKQALLKAMEGIFGDDLKRIKHARKVTDYAETIWKSEGGNYTITIGAAVLHDIGIHEAERKYGNSGGKYQEMEGPPIARGILTNLGFDAEQIDEICEIIGNHHSPGKINSTNFKVLYDADWLVNLADEFDIRDKKKLTGIIEKVFFTPTGITIARDIYLKGES